MKTTVERVDDTTVKLTVTVEAQRVDEALDHAARHLAQEVKVPGFRPGRVPRKVLESRLGPGALAQEAAREALPQFYAEAAQSEQLEVVSPPEFDDVTFEAGSDASFTATVQVRPEFDVPDYQGLQVAYPDWEATDEELQEQLDAMRERYAELETVERAVKAGDFVVITMTGERDGEPVDEVAVEDYLYEVPHAEEDDSELNKHLIGAKAGDVLTFTDSLAPDFGSEIEGQEVNLTTLVKEVKEKQLPELDDEFALTASEFDTIDELKDELRTALATQKQGYAAASLRGKVVEAVSDLVEIALPSSLVDEEVRFRLNRIAQQASQQGMSLDQYLSATGMQADQLLEELQTDAGKTVKAQLVLDAIGRDAGIDVDQSDLGEEVARQAARINQPIEDVAQFMTHPDRLPALVSDAFRRKTIDHLLEQVEVLGGPPPQEEADGSEAEASELDADGDVAAAADAESPAGAAEDPVDAADGVDES